MTSRKSPFRFLIQVPASTSNLGPGFDVFGLAVNLHLQVRVERSPSDADLVFFEGEGSGALSQEKENLILQVARHTARIKKIFLPGLQLQVCNHIPLSRGLGSSAAAIIAGISIAELFFRKPFSTDEIFKAALAFESHPDNLAAGLRGGFTAAKLRPDGTAVVQSLPIDRRLKVVAAIPDLEISTEKARRALPQSYPRIDIISNLQNAVLLSSMLAELPPHSLRNLFEDRLHQPYRAGLIPGLQEALTLPEMSGLAGTFLSGSGSTVAALATHHFSAIGRALQNCFSKHGMSSKMAVLSIDRKGRRVKRLT